ncbi:hypothetical protein SLOPH_1743, partial [Spraguea lophii 42_110]
YYPIMKYITLDLPIDCILSLNDNIIVGCYEYNDTNNHRKGKIYSLTKNLEIINFIETSGTLDIKHNIKDTYHRSDNISDISNKYDINNIKGTYNNNINNIKYTNNNIIYCCNAKDISVIDENLKLINILETKTINTYLHICNNIKYDNNIAYTDISGTVNIIDNNTLNNISSIKVTEDILWTVMVGNGIYAGGDYLYHIEDNKVNKIVIKNIAGEEEILQNITEIKEYGNEIIIGTYDNLYRIDVRNNKIINNNKCNGNEGSNNGYNDLYNYSNKDKDNIYDITNNHYITNDITNNNNINNTDAKEHFILKEKLDICSWRIKKYKDCFAIASMYDGVKIINNKNIIKEYKTESMAYGIEIVDDILFYSSFYDKKIFRVNLNDTIEYK